MISLEKDQRLSESIIVLLTFVFRTDCLKIRELHVTERERLQRSFQNGAGGQVVFWENQINRAEHGLCSVSHTQTPHQWDTHYSGHLLPTPLGPSFPQNSVLNVKKILI